MHAAILGAGGVGSTSTAACKSSLAGRFVRVTETLYFKFLMPESLSASWESSLRQRFDSFVACMREIWISDLPVADKLALAEPLLVMLKNVLPSAYPCG